MTGISTCRASSNVASILAPFKRPSRPISVNSRLATPASSNRRAKSTTGTSDNSAQPSVATMPSFASTATTMPPSHSFAISLTNSGFLSAAEPITTRDTPRLNQPSTPAASRIPPPNCTWPGKALMIASTASRFSVLPAKLPSKSTTCKCSAPACANSMACAAGLSP